ncbi:Hydroxyisourate hydrolase [Lophium mytilinum]|uniref:hydroxyisourate hydrolase n=1 Tax=Lophium mytilinum TaxID=390894 RepID=A0A6A6RDL8_9PEZI|nr:Hydroxyisourate hydrolase [Lophium mytilinum]
MPVPSTSTQAIQRLSTLSSHLEPSPASATSNPPTMSTAPRPPITCHVLDTTVGRPGANIPVTLTLVSPSSTASASFTSITNSDGRVTAWKPASDSHTSDLASVFQEPTEQVWALIFDTLEYFKEKGVDAFFPEVEIKFVVRSKEEHYHVPVLLGPFGYTTYRGS